MTSLAACMARLASKQDSSETKTWYWQSYMWHLQTNNASFANAVCKVKPENTMHSAFANGFDLQCNLVFYLNNQSTIAGKKKPHAEDD